MVAQAISAVCGEALLLGLATGPVCMASCGPVVVPWLLAQSEDERASASTDVRGAQRLPARAREQLGIETCPQGKIIVLPHITPDPIATVVVAEIQGAPQVIEAKTATSGN